MEITITITVNPKTLKQLKLYHNAGQHPAFQVETDAQLIELLVEEAYREMKSTKLGQKILQ